MSVRVLIPIRTIPIRTAAVCAAWYSRLLRAEKLDQRRLAMRTFLFLFLLVSSSTVLAVDLGQINEAVDQDKAMDSVDSQKAAEAVMERDVKKGYESIDKQQAVESVDKEKLLDTLTK
jgi:predicted transcriptional regulator